MRHLIAALCLVPVLAVFAPAAPDDEQPPPPRTVAVIEMVGITSDPATARSA